jgi:hypothetical protein
MKAQIFSFLLISMFFYGACVDKTGHAALFSMYVFIDGDTGKTVTITHLTAPEQKGPAFPNVEITRNVTIPFFEEIVTVCWDGSACDKQYIKVHTDGESDVRIIALLSDGIGIRNDTICNVINVITPFPEDCTGEAHYYCEAYELCRNYPIGSIYAYLEEIDYPAYKIMHKGDTYLELNIDNNVYNWKR